MNFYVSSFIFLYLGFLLYDDNLGFLGFPLDILCFFMILIWLFLLILQADILNFT